jgi:excisionase family DNA binding protein
MDWVCEEREVFIEGADDAGIQQPHKKPPARATIPPEAKLLVSREEAAQLLSISQRGLDYLIANRRLRTRRIGGRVLIPVADLRKYARGDHPENIVA